MIDGDSVHWTELPKTCTLNTLLPGLPLINVWWSLANNGIMDAKKLADWDYYIEQLPRYFHHLIGIHNGISFPTYQSIHYPCQYSNEETFKAKNSGKYKKPVVFDECRYEGNIPWSWEI
jgi:hypothetical protein